MGKPRVKKDESRTTTGLAAGARVLLRDLRKPGWGWFQDELLDFFAPLVGPYAVAVYLCLCRQAHGNDPQVSASLGEIVALWHRKGFRPSLSKTSIVRSLRLLVNAGMVKQLAAATNRTPASYGLVDLHALATELTEAHCDNLATMLDYQRHRREDENVSGVPVGNTAALLKTSGKACEEDVISTEIPGTLEYPGGNSRVSPGAPHLINTGNTCNTFPPTPQGGCSEFVLCAPEDVRNCLVPSVEWRQRWHVAAEAVRAHLLDAPSRKISGYVTGAFDWEQHFDSLVLRGIPARYASHFALRIESADPAATILAFRKYAKTWDRALRAAFGAPVLIELQHAVTDTASTANPANNAVPEELHEA